ncbi:M23 family metallopeptidase [Aliiroseovarius halocynthiae]|nr:M23 family metallopeptidase [Aliiroseovarius halocynthiae]
MTCAATPVAARDPLLRFPVDCTLGQDCFIQNYVDVDPSKGVADFTCGALSYDGHTGTDIALISDAAAAMGVNVTPAAPGIVRRLRDGMQDQFFESAFQHPEGQDCGNGVLIDHGGGWESQYCHLRMRSIAVEVGQRVGLQTVLGEIGMSGRTEFPHLHLSLRKDGRTVDPFNATSLTYCGDTEQTTLWDTSIPYRASGFVSAGFSSALPEYAAVKWGQAHNETLSTQAGALVLWAQLFGAQQDDTLRLTITGPQGAFFKHEEILDATQARAMQAAGRKLHAENTVVGDYRGEAALFRGKVEVDRISATTTLKTP